MNRKVVWGFIPTYLCFLVFLNVSLHAKPTQEQLNALRSIKTIRIEVERSYSCVHLSSIASAIQYKIRKIVDQSYSDLPFEEIVKRIMGYAGLKAVGSDTKNCDAVIRVKARGEPLEAEYIGLGKLRTGACLKGEISIETKGVIYKRDFDKYIYPPNTFSLPFNAFNEAFAAFIGSLVQIIREVYGLNTLIAALKDYHPDVRDSTALELGNLKEYKAVEPLITALKDSDVGVRRTAAWSLGEIGDARAVEPLIAALKDNDSNIRWVAADALGKIKDNRAVEPLIVALKDSNESVQNNAAWS